MCQGRELSLERKGEELGLGLGWIATQQQTDHHHNLTEHSTATARAVWQASQRGGSYSRELVYPPPASATVVMCISTFPPIASSGRKAGEGLEN